jgi:protein phosphatase
VALGVLAVLAVLVGGGVLARTWVLQQFYVGAADGRVAIFQGVRGTVLGLPLQQVVERSDIALTDLPEATRNSVEDGLLVTEGGLPGARTRVGMLRESMLVPCSALVPPTAAPTAAPEAAPTVPVDPTAAVQTLPAVPPGGATAAPPGPTLGSDTTPLPPVAPEPGRNCRQGS